MDGRTIKCTEVRPHGIRTGPNKGNKAECFLHVPLTALFSPQGLLPSEVPRKLALCRSHLLLSVPERDCHCQLCSAVSSPLCPDRKRN